MTDEQYRKALEHTLNYHSIDAKCSVPDFELANLLMPEFVKHLSGDTDVQVFERMTREERLQIGTEP